MKLSRAFRALVVTFVSLTVAEGCNAILGISEDPVIRSQSAGCLLKSDCSGNLICLFRVCSPPCQADRDCDQERGERCLQTALGTACVRDEVSGCAGAEPNCPEGTTCASGKCFSSCEGRPESCLADQLCAADRVCRGRPKPDASAPTVDASHPDANPGTPETPDATTDGPPAPECSPENVARCEGNAQATRSVCKGGLWTATEPCGDGKLCDTASTPTAECAPVADRCFGRTPNESFCDGATRVVCGVDLVSAETTTCESPQHCAAVTTGCAACLDNEFECDGTKLSKCKADHSGFGPFKTCEGSAPCNAQAGDCTSDACSANQKRCNGDKLEQCNATHSAFVALETCGAGLCDSTALECDHCVARSASCVAGKVRTCSDDGQTQTDAACPAARPFCTGAGTCVACLDAGNCTAPSDCTGKTCNAGVCGFPPIGRSIGCNGGVCDGAGSCVECLSVDQCTARNDCFTRTCGSDNKCSYGAKNPGDTCSGGFCDAAGACKGCLNSTQCTGNKPICAAGACVACTAEAQCAGKAIGLDHCRNATGACVACLTSGQCGNAAASICDATAFSCRGCTQASPHTAGDAECRARNGNAAPACKGGGDCAACTATNTTACPVSAPLCNTANNTCVGCLDSTNCSGTSPICSGNACTACTTNTQCSTKDSALPACKGSTGACVQCVANADCGGNKVCLFGNTCCTPQAVSITCNGSTCGTKFDNCGSATSCGSCGNGHCCESSFTPNLFQCQTLQCD